MQSDSLVIDAYATSLLHVYERATFKDEVAGSEWYDMAKSECRKISRETGFSHKRVVWAMAALSNNKSWESNVDICRNVCFALRHHMEPKGHFKHLIDKAKRILVDGDFSALSGPKVIPFAQAIWQPSSDACVIDRWMWRAAHDEVASIPLYLSPARLRRTAIALRRVSNHVKLPCTIVQATIWTVIRRESSILPTGG